MIRVGFETRPTGTLAKLDEHIESRSITLDNGFYVENDQWYLLLTVSSEEEYDFESIFEEISGTGLFHEEEITDSPYGVNSTRLMVFSLEPYPFILNLILRNRAIPNQISLVDSSLDIVVSVEDWDTFQNLGDEIQDKMGEFGLLEVTQVDELGEPLDTGRVADIMMGKLTEKQVRALETAHEMGYFEQPSQATASDVADELGVAQSTISQRLRKAENDLLNLIFR